MTTKIEVSFSCNDPDNGHFRGWFDAVEFSDGTTLETLCSLTQSTGEQTILKLLGNRFVVGGDFTLHSNGTWREWEGNWCWNSCTMSLFDARRLLRYLWRHGFSLEEWGDDGPLRDVVAEIGLAETGAFR